MKEIYHKIRKLNFCFGIFLIISAFSCNPYKKLKEGEFILEKNIIIDENFVINKEEIEPFIRQKPNRKIAKLIPIHSWFYSQFDQKKIDLKKEKRNKKYEQIDKKRKEKLERKKQIKNKSQDDQEKNIKTKDKSKPLFIENLRDMGEPPVILDSFQVNVSRDQIQKYIYTKGYFNSKVKQTCILKEKKKILFFSLKRPHAIVTYTITKSNPYKIRSLNYKIIDKQLAAFIKNDSINCLIKRSANYDASILEKERDRLIKSQKNNGYFELLPDRINFSIDSNLKSNELDITINLKQSLSRSEKYKDSLIGVDHIRYSINNIYVLTDFNPDPNLEPESKDTIYSQGIFFIYNKKNKFRTKDLANKILLHPGEIYSAEIAEQTYNKLTELKVFKTVNITFKKNKENNEKLDCFINLNPVKKQSFTVETEGTNTSGNLGIAGSFVYQNRNIFRGAELLEIILSSGLTAQKNLSTENEITNDLGIPILNSFNTFQFGPEINLYIPKQLFPFSLFKFNKNSTPKTILTSSFNYQKRPEFTRLLSNVSYGFSFKFGDHIKQQIIPFEVSFIKANLKSSFKNALDQSNDAFLKNSFIDHITPVSRYSLQFNNQTGKNIKQKKIFTYFKLDLESSGSVLRGLFNLTNQVKDDSGRYRILNVPFSQFLRAYSDLRVYKNVGKFGRIVFRTALGLGKPLNNLSVLPYEKSFFGGGPNSVRAWEARALGPGAYSQTNDNNFDKIGDSQIEFNLEYRFNIYKFLNGAFFIDAGNIWLLNPDVLKPNGNFLLTKFYKEFATGTGMGIRADFDFFILRFDAAFKIYSPKLPEGDRWMFDKKPLKTTVVNFGIGYPF